MLLSLMARMHCPWNMVCIDRSAAKNVISPSDVSLAAGDSKKNEHSPLSDGGTICFDFQSRCLTLLLTAPPCFMIPSTAGEDADGDDVPIAEPAGPPGTESVDFRFCYGAVSQESSATLLKEEVWCLFSRVLTVFAISGHGEREALD